MMLVPSLFPDASVVVTLSLLSFVTAQSIPGAAYFQGNGVVGASSYQLIDDYEGSSSGFFNKFNYYSVSRMSKQRCTGRADVTSHMIPPTVTSSKLDNSRE